MGRIMNVGENQILLINCLVIFLLWILISAWGGGRWTPVSFPFSIPNPQIPQSLCNMEPFSFWGPLTEEECRLSLPIVEGGQEESPQKTCPGKYWFIKRWITNHTGGQHSRQQWPFPHWLFCPRFYRWKSLSYSSAGELKPHPGFRPSGQHSRPSLGPMIPPPPQYSLTSHMPHLTTRSYDHDRIIHLLTHKLGRVTWPALPTSGLLWQLKEL